MKQVLRLKFSLDGLSLRQVGFRAKNGTENPTRTQQNLDKLRQREPKPRHGQRE